MKSPALLHIPHCIARFCVVFQIMIKDFHNIVLNHAMVWNVSTFKGHNLPVASVGSSFLQHMMTSSNGNILRVTGPLCCEFTGPGEFPTQRPVTRRFDVFFDLRLKKRLSKQPWGWWFETPSLSLWRHCNELQRRFSLLGASLTQLKKNLRVPWKSRRKLHWMKIYDYWHNSVDYCLWWSLFNSLRPSDAYMRQWTNHH